MDAAPRTSNRAFTTVRGFTTNPIAVRVTAPATRFPVGVSLTSVVSLSPAASFVSANEGTTRPIPFRTCCTDVKYSACPGTFLRKGRKNQTNLAFRQIHKLKIRRRMCT